MWPFKKNAKIQADPRLCAIVDDYLATIPTEDGWDDEDIYQELVKKGHEPEATWSIVGLVPIFAGRLIMKGLGPEFSDRLDFHGSKGIERSCLLKNYPPYVAISAREKEIRDHENSKAIAGTGAEVNAINQLLHSGSNPKDLILTPVALLLRND